MLAELDDQRYQIAAKQAQTAADAARTCLEQLVPQMLVEAEAALSLANKELQRYTNLVRTQSEPQQQLDLAETAQKAATAKVAQVQALRATKQSLLTSSLAAVEQAEVNIGDCKLNSPFTGQIARVHVIPGGYVLPGQPVITQQRWLLRPGDLAEMSLLGEGRPAGFYVPCVAILNDGAGCAKS